MCSRVLPESDFVHTSRVLRELVGRMDVDFFDEWFTTCASQEACLMMNSLQLSEGLCSESIV